MVKQTMTGGEAVLAALQGEGIDTVFGIPGRHSIPLYGALLSASGLRHVLGRHEQGLVYMADGYSRASGRIGVAVATSGPAVANMIGAMGGATTDTSSVLVIASTVRSDQIGRNRGGLHDLGESLDLARPVCRAVHRCRSVEEIPQVIAGLVAQLRNGRPGAVYCEIPTDVLTASAAVTLPGRGVSTRRQPADDDVNRAVELLAGAKRPVIWAGTGVTVSGADEEVAVLARRLGAVVVTSALGRGIMQPDDEHFAMNDGGRLTEVDEVIAHADVVLAVGTMFKNEDTSGWQTNLGERLIHVDVDEEEIGRSYTPTVGIVGDAKATLGAILKLLPAREPAPPAWRRSAKEAEAAYLAKRRSENPGDMAILDAFAAGLPEDAILVCDRCSLGYWVWRCLPAARPRSFQYPLGYGGLGGALPQAVGAKIAAPARPVVCVIGDGGIQFTLAELAVAVQESTPITILLCNNAMYGAIAAGMRRAYDTDAIGCRLVNPSFAKIASAYGIPHTCVTETADLTAALRTSIASGVLNIVELTVPIADPPA